MIFSCNAIELSDALSKVTKAIPIRVPIPVMECIKIEASENFVKLTATDTAFTIEVLIVSNVQVTGTAVVPGKLFFELIRRIGESEIDIELLQNNLLAVKYADGETKIKCINSDEFSPILQYEYDDHITIKQSDFKNLINTVIFSASQDETESRRNIKGCFFECTENVVKLVALDGYRLAVAKKDLGFESPNLRAIIPAKNLIEISRIIESDDTEIVIYVSEKRMLIESGNVKITTGLYGGEFFNYKTLVSGENETVVGVNKKQLLDSIERATIMSRSEKNYQIRIEIKENFMSIVGSGGAGDVNEKIAVSLEGKDLTIAFNSKFLAESLKAISDEYITMRFTNSVKPCIIEPVDGDGFLYLIIPVRIQG